MKVVERAVVSIGFKVEKDTEKKALDSFAKVDKAGKKVSMTMRSRVATGARVAGTAFGAFAAATSAAVLATGTFVVQQAAANDELAKTAGALGFAVEEYSKLELAMAFNGVESGKLQASLNGLSGKLFDAATNGGESKKMLDRLGVSATNADGSVRSVADILPDLADGFAGLKEGERVGLAIKLLGESGGRLGAALALGSDEMRKMNRELEGLGLTAEAAQSSSDLIDALTSLQAVSTALARVFTAELAPEITVLVEQLTDWLKASDGIVRSGVTAAAKGMAVVFRFLATDAGKAAAALVATVGAIVGGAGIATAAAAAFPVLGTLATALGYAGAAAGLVLGPAVLLALAIDDIVVTAQGGDSMLRRLGDAMGITDGVASVFWGTLDLVSSSVDLLGVYANEAAASISDGLMSALETVADWIDKYAPSLAGLADTVRGLVTGAGSGVNGFLEGVGSALSEQAGANRQIAAYARGEDVATPESLSGGLGVDPVGGDAVVFTRARKRAIRDATAAGAGSPSVSNTTNQAAFRNEINIRTGPSSRAMAREAGKQAERASLRALQAVEG